MKANRILFGLASFFLVVWGLTLIISRGTVAFALSDPVPLPIDPSSTPPALSDRFVQIRGTPNHDLAVAYRRYGVSSYWYPLVEHENRFLVKADAALPRSTGSAPQLFQGRLRPMGQVAFSSHILQRFLQDRGLELPPDSLVVSVDESPRTFLPMLLLGAPVTAVWLGVLLVVMAMAARAATRRS